MEGFGPGGNLPEKVVHLQRWSSLTGRFSPTETCPSNFKNSHFKSDFTEKKWQFWSKCKWNALVRLEILFLSNNVAPFSLG